MSVRGIKTKWLLLLALSVAMVGAVDVYYEDNPDLERSDQLFELDNIMGSEDLGRPDPELLPGHSPDQLLYQYQQQAYPHTEKLATFPYRSRWLNPGLEHLMLPKRTAEAAPSNAAAFKPAVVPSKARVPGVKPQAIKPQPKWKIKKGAHMICYFKLCSFRVYPTS